MSADQKVPLCRRHPIHDVGLAARYRIYRQAIGSQNKLLLSVRGLRAFRYSA